ncbi:hypothetical protein FOZ60_016740 [Perkinsus olseni]|uniref:Uncharacterized protein n=1 Tax=Perkinsus olseni TaxID=32597 RepID=A0A7J6P476_PEROL|nr:hypothetical protein FOZ60_016740 [Perkinsus olseni]
MPFNVLLALFVPSALGVISLRERPFKFYCHFHKALQSVCFRTKEWYGIVGINANEIFAYEDHPRMPYYNSSSSKAHPRASYVDVRPRGAWVSIETGKFPWPVEYPIKYEKVDGRNGQPGYFDVNFTDYDRPRRFTRLMPVSMYDIPLRGDPPQAEFVVHHPTKWTAILKQGRYSETKKRYKRVFELRVNFSESEWVLRNVKTLDGGIVKGFRGNVAGRREHAEAFFFELPTNGTQYGLVVTSGVESFVLYRTDEVTVRDHDMLPPG